MEEIKNIEYKMEWVDHLFDIYRDFGRRNSIDEWLYFLRRPELSNPKERQLIAEEILNYILKYEHISKNILELLEENFHYTEAQEHFMDTYGIGALDYYRQILLGREEFPPYRLFEDIHDGADYDGFISAFKKFYNLEESEDIETIQKYSQMLDEVKAFEIEHPYMALLESEFYAMCKDYKSALKSLHDLEDCYHKYLSTGFIFMDFGYYEDAEKQFEAAMEYEEGNLDRGLISAVFFAKYYGGRPEEALAFADGLAEQGYEPLVIPLKIRLLEELTRQLAEKAEQEELDEAEYMLLSEYFMLIDDYETVIALCKQSKSRGFTNSKWTVNLAEGYFAAGRIDEAEEIISACYNGDIKLDNKNFDKIRTLKAQLLFEQGKTAEAYELIESLCGRDGCRFKDMMVYAKMCAITGRMEDAIKFYNTLRFNVPENPIFSFELGKCMLKVEKPETAHTLFQLAIKNDNEFYQAIYYMVQASIDSGELDHAKQEIKALNGRMDDKYIQYLKGQIAEMEENFKEAKDIYLKIIQNKNNNTTDKTFLEEVFLRYFLVREETGTIVITMIKELNDALEYAPWAADLWVQLGEVHENSEVKEELAKMCFEKAHEANPYNEMALAHLIEREMYEDNWQQAFAYCNEIILNTQGRDYYLTRANCELELDLDREFAMDIAEFVKKGGDERETYDLCSLNAVKKGDYETAMAVYDKRLITREARELPCYKEMAVCLCKQDKPKEACALLQAAIASGGKNPEWLWLLFEIQLTNGYFDGASQTLSDIKKATKVTIFNEDYTLAMAQLSLATGKMFKARRLAESIAANDGEQLCAIIYTLDGNYRGAARMFKKLIKKEEFNVDHYSWLSLCLSLWGKHKEAAVWAGQGIEVIMKRHITEDKMIRPDHLCQYAILLFMSAQQEKAYEILQKALAARPCYEQTCSRCYEAHYAIGICQAFEGNMEKARESFEESLKIRPDNMICRTIYNNMMNSMG